MTNYNKRPPSLPLMFVCKSVRSNLKILSRFWSSMFSLPFNHNNLNFTFNCDFFSVFSKRPNVRPSVCIVNIVRLVIQTASFLQNDLLLLPNNKSSKWPWCFPIFQISSEFFCGKKFLHHSKKKKKRNS